MAIDKYDIVIIGLGPAGATFARLINKGFSVAAIDRKGTKGDLFQKPCGGLLAPDAQKALARFDLTLPKEVLVDPQIFSVRTIDLDSGLAQHYQRFYVNIDRQKFDSWLKSIISPEVTIFDGAECGRIRREDGGFTIAFRQGGVERQIWARWLVGADGANSLVRKTFFPAQKIRSYVAIQQWFHDSNAKPFYSCVFDSKNTDCYSWGISKDGNFIFGGAYPADNCRKRFDAQKEALVKHGFFFGEPIKAEGCLVLRPSSSAEFCCGGGNIFLIGEAAGFISPSSLEGISGGIQSATFLSEAFSSGRDPLAAYRKKTRMLCWKLSGKLLKCPFMYWPWVRRFVMKSGLTSIDILADSSH